jgi:hypothetical protein
MYISRDRIKITGKTGIGTMRIKSKTQPTGKNLTAISKGGNSYEITIQPDIEYVINYSAL